jgi:formylmethanofuran dehydrogenase subunit E
MTTGYDGLWEEDFRKCVDFHGHACPGLAMGYVAAKAAMAWLGERRAEDEEIVAIVETDACGADAVQVMTGCTFGKGNLLFKDYGKTAFSFLSRASGKGIRLCAKPSAFSLTPEHRALFEKVWSGKAGEEDLKAFWELHRQRTLDVLKRPADDLYLLQEVTTRLPPRAQVLDSRTCGRCGEPVMASRLTETKEGLLCRACLAVYGIQSFHQKPILLSFMQSLQMKPEPVRS